VVESAQRRIVSLNDNTVPQVLYNTPDPHSKPSELYVINGTILPTATDPIKRWVIKEEHGYWDEETKQFKIRAKTMHPTEHQYCFSIDDIHGEIKRQMMSRVKEGFKYQLEWYPYELPFYRKYEIALDGTRKRYL
jgi:hypothetical protein